MSLERVQSMTEQQQFKDELSLIDDGVENWCCKL